VKAGRATEVQARFFAPKGFTEELYDLQRDPDNINNLIHNPEQAARVQKMHKALGKWQRSIYDTALIPESEMVKRSSENGLTVYELTRNPDLYPLDELIDAADLALEKDAANLPQLHRLLQAEDCGIRYWGMVGCFLLEEDSVVDAGLADDSHEVRALAAWLAIKTSRKEQGLQCLEELLKQKSYATLTVLNMVEWLGEDGHALMSTVRALEPKKKSYEERMKKNLLAMEKDA
jgi:hypothetical protein